MAISGPPGAGKTTLGRAVATRLQAALLDLDVATAPLTVVVSGLLGTDDLDALAPAARAARYETLAALAVDNLRVGRPVVLIAPFSIERREPAAWTRLAGRLALAGGAPVLVWLRVDARALQQRIRDRAADRDRPRLAGGDPLRRIDLSEPAAPHLSVDATADTARQCAVVLAALP